MILEDGYAWKFTGIPYLDGIIFAAASPKNKYTIRINVSLLPGIITDEIIENFNKIGYQADCYEVPNALTKQTDLRIEAIGPSPIFNVLPRFKERRVDLNNTPYEFITGIFTVSSKVKLGKYSSHTNYKGDGIIIRSALPIEDLKFLLEMIEITDTRTWSNHIYIDRPIFRDIQPFERIYQEFLKEDTAFSSYMPSKEDVLGQKIDEISKEIWEVPEFNGNWEDDY